MVLNLCLPHYNTTVHCNKLCADGYDVTNLVSAEPAVRRRGFKLEYFLRPPVQVTLTFGFQVELCRLDVELWPWGMDQGQACKRLEISTSSDPAQDHKRPHKSETIKTHNRDLHQEPRPVCSSKMVPGQQWSLQARRWGDEAPPEPQRALRAPSRHAATEPSSPEPEFKLVGRCELREDTRVSFSNSSFRHRPPFPLPPPPRPARCRQEELWSRGLPSLGAVTQLRVAIPFGGAASALGFKALAVWGQPARGCTAEELEKIKRIHEACERPPPPPGLFTSALNPKKTSAKAEVPLSTDSIPDEFLDPITQEVMVLPMLLPSGVSVDNSTLEEHQKREATWGRAPSDPFTGVPFTSRSQPVPNPQLKSRIDHFLLQSGTTGANGRLGRRGEGERLQASRLVAAGMDASALESPRRDDASSTGPVTRFDADGGDSRTEEHPAARTGRTPEGQPAAAGCNALWERGKKRHLNGEPGERPTAVQPLPSAKRRRGDAGERALHGMDDAQRSLRPAPVTPRDAPVPSGSASHEERLSASLDDALLSVLRGRPSFTANLSLQRRPAPESEPARGSQDCHAASAGPAGEKTCSACSCSVSVYSLSTPSVYRLACGHLLCRACLQMESQRGDAAGPSASCQVSCPSCHRSAPRGHIVRVHR